MSWILSIPLARTRIDPNFVTVIWAVALVGASVAVAIGDVFVALVLTATAVFLDCLDGDVARARSAPSLSGTLLEQAAHSVGNMSIIAGVAAAYLSAFNDGLDIALALALVVLQAVYIQVLRQVRPNAINLPGPRARRALRLSVGATWVISPIEIPIVVVIAVFPIQQATVIVLGSILAALSVSVFTSQFMLILNADRLALARSSVGVDDPLGVVDAAEALSWELRARFPSVSWWAPGSSQRPEVVRDLMGQQPYARQSPALVRARDELASLLPLVFKTSGRVVTMEAPIEAAFEAAIRAILDPGSRLLIVGSRAYGNRLARIAAAVGIVSVQFETCDGDPFDGRKLAEVLAESPEVDALWLQLVDEQGGELLDLGSIWTSLVGKGCWRVVDASLGLCVDEFRMDAWGVDVAISGADGGLAGPPGLSLVALGPRMVRRLSSRDEGGDRDYGAGFLDLRSHLSAKPDLPPSPAVAALYASVRMVLSVGIDNLTSERDRAARAFRSQCEGAGFRTLASRPSAACTVLSLPNGLELAEVQRELLESVNSIAGAGRTGSGQEVLKFGHSGWSTGNELSRIAEVLDSVPVTAAL